MQKYIIIFFVTIFSNSGYAQSKGSNIISITPTRNLTGILYGYSSIEHNAFINGMNFKSNNSALNLGLLFEKEFDEKMKLSFRPGLLITDDIRNRFSISGKNYSYSYPGVIFEVPLFLIYSFKTNKNFNGIPDYFQVGSVFGYNFANKSVKYTGPLNSTFLPAFSKNNETSIRFGLGYDFKFKYVNLRPEFGYSFGFNSLNKNTIPNINISKITNNQYILHFVLSQRMNKVIYKKVDRIGPPLWKKIFRSFKGK
jgi:hypothetical protein